MLEIKLGKSKKLMLQMMLDRFNLPMNKLILPMVFIVFGILLGSISSNYLNASEELEMHQYFSGFLNMVNVQTVDRGALFHQALTNNTKVYLLLLFMSISVIGIPFIYAIIAVKGFIVGFTAGIAFKVLEAKGLAVVLCLILPKELILLSAYILIAALGVALCSKMIHMILSSKKNGFEPEKNFIPKHMLKFIPCYVLLIIGCFFEAFVCPVLLKMVL